ncbi:MAG: nucleotidyltransferase domain-containing protein [candidate division WOR-3 bacterium]
MDIFQIFKSKLRRHLLSLYFTNPAKKFYLRELERILDFPVGNIRRELIRLEKTGLFLTEHKGNLVYYYLNQTYPLFAELKGIIAKTIGVPIIIASMLKKKKGIKQAFIYGSFAKNEQKPKSDIDIFIIGEIDEAELVKRCCKLEKELQREINYTLYSPTDFTRKKKKKDPFLLEVLSQPKIFLIGSEDEL